MKKNRDCVICYRRVFLIWGVVNKCTLRMKIVKYKTDKQKYFVCRWAHYNFYKIGNWMKKQSKYLEETNVCKI